MRKLFAVAVFLMITGKVFAGTWPNDVRDVRVYGNGLISTDMEQYKVNQGEIYVLTDLQASLANGASFTYLIDVSTVTAEDVNIRLGVVSDQNLQVHLRYEPTIASSGTIIVEQCLNLDYGEDQQGVIYYEPDCVGTSTGSILAEAMSIANSGTGMFGGIEGSRTYWHLTCGHPYLIVINNASGAAAAFSIWIETIREDN